MNFLTFNLAHTATTDNSVGISIPVDVTLDNIQIVPNVTTAANGTNYVTIAVRNAADDADVFSINTSSTGFTAGTPLSVSLSGDLDYDADEVLIVSATDAASGASCDLSITASIVPRRSI